MGNKLVGALRTSALTGNALQFQEISHQRWHGHATCLDFDPFLNILAVGTSDGAVKLFGGAGIENLLVDPLEDESLVSVHLLHHQGALIATSESMVRLWDLGEKKVVFTLAFNDLVDDTICSTFSWQAYHQRFMYIGTHKGTVYTFDVTQKQLSSYVIKLESVYQELSDKTAPEGLCEVVDVDVNPAEEGYLLIAYQNGKVVLWNLAASKVHREFATIEGGVRSVSWNPQGTHFAVGLHNGFTEIWKRKSPQHAVCRIAVTADEKDRAPVFKVLWQKSTPHQLARGDENGILHIGGGSHKSNGVFQVKGQGASPIWESEYRVTHVAREFPGSCLDFVIAPLDPAIDSTKHLPRVNRAQSQPAGPLAGPAPQRTRSDSKVPIHSHSGTVRSIISLSDENNVYVSVPEMYETVIPITQSNDITCVRFLANSTAIDAFVRELETWTQQGRVTSPPLQREKYQDLDLWPMKAGVNAVFNGAAPGGLLISGHKDGVVRFWSIGGLSSFQLVSELDTRQYYQYDDGEDEDPQEQQSDPDGCCIVEMTFDLTSRSLCVGHNNGHVIHVRFGRVVKAESSQTSPPAAESTPSPVESKGQTTDETPQPSSPSNAPSTPSTDQVSSNASRSAAVPDTNTESTSVQEQSEMKSDSCSKSALQSDTDPAQPLSPSQPSQPSQASQPSQKQSPPQSPSSAQQPSPSQPSQQPATPPPPQGAPPAANRVATPATPDQASNLVSAAYRVCADLASKSEVATPSSPKTRQFDWHLEHQTAYTGAIKSILFNCKLQRLVTCDSSGLVSMIDVASSEVLLFNTMKSVPDKSGLSRSVAVSYIHIGSVGVSEDAFAPLVYLGLTDGSIMMYRLDGRPAVKQPRLIDRSLLKGESDGAQRRRGTTIALIQTVDNYGVPLPAHKGIKFSKEHFACLLVVSGSQIYILLAPTPDDKSKSSFTTIKAVAHRRSIINGSVIRYPTRRKSLPEHVLAVFDAHCILTVYTLMDLKAIYTVDFSKISPRISLNTNTNACFLHRSGAFFLLSQHCEVVSGTLIRAHQPIATPQVYLDDYSKNPPASPAHKADKPEQPKHKKSSLFNTLFGNDPGAVEMIELFKSPLKIAPKRSAPPKREIHIDETKLEATLDNQKQELFGDRSRVTKEPATEDARRKQRVDRSAAGAHGKMNQNVQKMRQNVEKTKEIEDRAERMNMNASNMLDLATALRKKNQKKSSWW